MPKTILCFGDSNTWGLDPATSRRFPTHQRWPGVMRERLGSAYLVIEEGLVGRTTVRDDPLDPHKNGLAYLAPCLQSHSPIDLVILMLGSNDMKRHFDLSSLAIAEGMRRLVSAIQNSACGIDLVAPKVLLLSPPPIIGLTALADLFGAAEQKSLDLPGLYAEIATEKECWFYDAGQAICSSPTDGVHFDADQHQKLGCTLTEKVIDILG
jgi:lysophospholipase L1-like esterase